MRSGAVNNQGVTGRLYYLIKLPQSGGSTFANEWVRQASSGRPRVVLGGDDFRLGLHGQEYARTAEGMVFACMDAAARALLARGFDVLMDETSTTEQTLLRYYLIDFEAVPILIDVEAEECIRRALANGRPYLVEPIKAMAEQRRDLLKDWPNVIERVKARLLKRYPNFLVGDRSRGNSDGRHPESSESETGRTS
jgi:predicted kinase